MLYNKQKRLIKHVILGLVLLVSTLAVTTLAVNRPVQAAFTCNPNSAPCCQAPQLTSGATAPISCFDSAGKKFYPVGDNPDKSPEPELGHCYTVKNTDAFGFVYFNADCTKAPFSVDAANFTKYQPAKIDCQAKTGLNKNNCGIISYLVIFINVLSGLVGLVVVGSIIIAGIQWSTAGNDPQKIESARNRIVNSLLALLVFVFMFAFLQWVVPGGIF